MKKGTIFAIVLAVILIFGLGSLALYLTLQYQDDIFNSKPSKTEEAAEAMLLALEGKAEWVSSDSSEEEDRASGDADAASETDMATAESELTAAELLSHETESESEDPVYIYENRTIDKVIWVGDSRTEGMYNAVRNDDVYIARCGEGYDWFMEEGEKEMEKAIKADPKAPVVFNLGVNDLANTDLYLSYYKSLPDTYPDTRFYFLSVNPIEPTLCPTISNVEITDFNGYVRNLYPDQFIDSFTFLMVEEVQTIDGVHYSKDGYRTIYRYAIDQLQRLEK